MKKEKPHRFEEWDKNDTVVYSFQNRIKALNGKSCSKDQL